MKGREELASETDLKLTGSFLCCRVLCISTCSSFRPRLARLALQYRQDLAKLPLVMLDLLITVLALLEYSSRSLGALKQEN